MAFTGTPVVTQISDRIVSIQGLSLDAGASGTIGLAAFSGTTPGVTLPEAFKPTEYKYIGDSISLAEAIEVTALPAAVGVATAIPVAVVKTGNDPAAWRATITNTHATLATPLLEIMVKYHE